jgi:hypothetical protein
LARRLEEIVPAFTIGVVRDASTSVALNQSDDEAGEKCGVIGHPISRAIK